MSSADASIASRRSPATEAFAAAAVTTGGVFTVADLSLRPKAGVKGRACLDWLAAEGLAFDHTPNRATRLADGAIVLVLASNEAVLLDPTGSAHLPDTGRLGRPLAPGVYPVPRGPGLYWLTVSGPVTALESAFSRLAAVDLRPTRFVDGSIAQTQIARVSATVARVDAGGAVVYHLVGDAALADHVAHSVLAVLGQEGGLARLEPAA
jgi:sarcosine oxidase subunit gamma